MIFNSPSSGTDSLVYTKLHSCTSVLFALACLADLFKDVLAKKPKEYWDYEKMIVPHTGSGSLRCLRGCAHAAARACADVKVVRAPNRVRSNGASWTTTKSRRKSGGANTVPVSAQNSAAASWGVSGEAERSSTGICLFSLYVKVKFSLASTCPQTKNVPPV